MLEFFIWVLLKFSLGALFHDRLHGHITYPLLGVKEAVLTISLLPHSNVVLNPELTTD